MFLLCTCFFRHCTLNYCCYCICYTSVLLFLLYTCLFRAISLLLPFHYCCYSFCSPNVHHFSSCLPSACPSFAHCFLCLLAFLAYMVLALCPSSSWRRAYEKPSWRRAYETETTTTHPHICASRTLRLLVLDTSPKALLHGTKWLTSAGYLSE